jgi:hypothetical protein
MQRLLLPLHLHRNFQAQRVESDEARGVVLIVGPAQRDRVGFHRWLFNSSLHAGRKRTRQNSTIAGRRAGQIRIEQELHRATGASG